MTVVTITLSDDEELLVRERAAMRGFTDVEKYVKALLAENLRNNGEEGKDNGAPEELHVTSKDRLKQLIQEGLDSPAQVMTKEDWTQFRHELVERYGPVKSE